MEKTQKRKSGEEPFFGTERRGARYEKARSWALGKSAFVGTGKKRVRNGRGRVHDLRNGGGARGRRTLSRRSARCEEDAHRKRRDDDCSRRRRRGGAVVEARDRVPRRAAAIAARALAAQQMESELALAQITFGITQITITKSRDTLPANHDRITIIDLGLY